MQKQYNKHILPSNYVNSARWDAQEKVDSRIYTIRETYRQFFGRWSILYQYWALAGSHTRQGLQIMGEVDHLMKDGLFESHQYFGVDREEEIIKNNKIVHPEINWIHDDFYEAMHKAVISGTFKPSIINYDGVMQPKYSAQYLKKIMVLLDYNVSHEMMLVANFVLTNPYTNSKTLNFSIEKAIEELSEIYNIPDHWYLHCEYYQYIHSQANMGILIFLKDKHDIKNFNISSNRIVGYKGGEHEIINNG